jgi:long-chain fatty acid transport protein
MSRMRAGLGLAALLVMLLVPLSQVQAGGFSIYEQGARAMGRASAFVAMPSDPSAIFYNPAGLTLLDGTQIYVGGTIIMPTGEFDGLSPLGAAATGTMKSQIFTPPNLYITHRLNEKMVVGLGLHTPFGLGTAWKDPATWAGRWVSVDSEIQMFGINPTFAYQVNDQLSVGVGVDYRMSSVNVEQYYLNPAPPPLIDVATVKLESDMNSAIGFNFGVLYALNEKMNLGLAYRSPVTIEYTGTATITSLIGSPEVEADVETAIDYPGVFTAGLAYKLSDNLLVEGDIQYWFWSVFKDLSISGLPTGDVTMDENYEDAFELRVGLEYWKSETMALRAGFVHDQTPVPKESISPMLPDASRNGITGGVGLTFGSITVDAAFMYLMFADAETATTMPMGYPTGTYKNSALLFGVNLGFAIGK